MMHNISYIDEKVAPIPAAIPVKCFRRELAPHLDLARIERGEEINQFRYRYSGLEKMAAAEDESADRSADPIDSEEHRVKRKKKKKKHERLVNRFNQTH